MTEIREEPQGDDDLAFTLTGYPSGEHYRIACIMRGLVGTDYRRQYFESAEFKASIEVLARLLIQWVPGLSQKAIQAEVARAAIQDSLERTGKLPELTLQKVQPIHIEGYTE